MITIKIVCVGNLKEKFWVEACNEYIKRLSKFCKLKVVEIKEENQFENIDKTLEVEGEDILKELEGYTSVLDIEGKMLSSEEIASLISEKSNISSTLTFVIGGSYGVADKVKGRADKRISFGKVTYPHNIARVLLLEQIYRAFMINSGSKYHK